jgi:undecaprenyl-diphosphatase
MGDANHKCNKNTPKTLRRASYNKYMLKQQAVKFDAIVLGRVQHWPGWLYAPMAAASIIGNPIVLWVAASAIAYFAWQQTLTSIVIVMCAAIVAMATNSVLKHFIHRTRPDTLYVSKMWFKTSSFPSGHTFSSTVFFGLLGVLAVQFLTGPTQILLPILLVALIATVGVSRVYLGAHYPSDVVAGWLFGSAVLGIIIFTYFQL